MFEIIALKIASLFGFIAMITGLFGLLVTESLADVTHPYRWQLFVGGLIVFVVSVFFFKRSVRSARTGRK